MATAAYYGTKLSAHISRTPENFVICHDVPLCRTAERVPMLYRGSEIGLPTDDSVEVYRSAAEVLHPKHIASIEAKPVLAGHTGFVNADTAGWQSRGHVQNVRPGPRLPDGERSVMGDIVITDATLAQQVLDGQLREVSLGYACIYEPRGDGAYSQRQLRCNHCALVPDGRAGEHIRIYDSSSPPVEEDFAALARRYHRQNPAETGAARAAEQRAADRLPESLRLGNPQSWDEVAAQHRELIEGEEMPKNKTQDDDEPTLQETLAQVLVRLSALEQKAEEPDEHAEEDDEEDDSPESAALQHLRSIKAVVAATGDRNAIDSYNEAVRAVKRRIRDNRVLSVDARTTDARFRQLIDAELGLDRQLEDMARCFHRRSVPEGQSAYEAATAANPTGHRASPTFDGFLRKNNLLDPPAEVVHGFVDSASAMRAKMLEGKK